MFEPRQKLLAVVRDVLHRIDTGATRCAASTMSIDAAEYTDPEIHAADCRDVFRRVPLVLAASGELPAAGAYKTIDVAGVSVLLARDHAGSARAYLNSCPHRGAKLKSDAGVTGRFTCPYHGWTFALSGELIAMPLAEEFGLSDESACRLLALPLYENAGLIWVTLDPHSDLRAPTFLQGFDYLLEPLGLASWHVDKQTALPGTNWKLAFNAHLEFYHLPVLHKETFGTNISNRALHYFWGPHQRLVQPSYQHKDVPDDANIFSQRTNPEEKWSDLAMMLGEWIIFPNVSINLFFDGALGIILSQVLPGTGVNESVTIQTYLTATAPEGDALTTVMERAVFLAHVVATEDLPTSAGQAQNLTCGLQNQLVLGRNEAGVQHFHKWLALVTGASGSLDKIFSYAPDWSAP